MPYEAEATEARTRLGRTIKPQYSNASYTANLTAMTQMKNLNGYNGASCATARCGIRARRRRSRPLKVVTFDEKVEKLTYYRLNEEQISYAEHEAQGPRARRHCCFYMPC